MGCKMFRACVDPPRNLVIMRGLREDEWGKYIYELETVGFLMWPPTSLTILIVDC